MASFNWPSEGSGGGDTVSFNSFGSTPNAAGGSVTTGAITLQPADATHPGGVTTGTQTIAGAKTLSTSVQSPANYHLDASEHNAGNSSTAQTIDWSTGSAQLSTLTGNVTYTFTNPVAGGAYILRINTGAGSFSGTWPINVAWPGGVSPTITATAAKVDLVNFYYDGTNYYGSISQNY